MKQTANQVLTRKVETIARDLEFAQAEANGLGNVQWHVTATDKNEETHDPVEIERLKTQLETLQAQFTRREHEHAREIAEMSVLYQTPACILNSC
jgi:hypothetical protein